MDPLTITIPVMDDLELQTLAGVGSLLDGMEIHQKRRILEYWISRADTEMLEVPKSG